MDDTSAKLAQLEAKIDAIYVSVEKTRKYFQWTLIATVVMFVLPFLGILLLIPKYLQILNQFSSF